jgi:hypothetical protein
MPCNNLQYVEVCEEGREIYGINNERDVSVLVANALKVIGVTMKLNLICCH